MSLGLVDVREAAGRSAVYDMSARTEKLRLPISMLEELKALANKGDVPYQSLMKIYLVEQIRRERGRKAS